MKRNARSLSGPHTLSQVLSLWNTSGSSRSSWPLPHTVLAVVEAVVRRGKSSLITLSVPADRDRGSIWLDEQVFPSYVAAASLFILLLHAAWVSKPLKKLRGLHATDDYERVEASKGYIDRIGGTTIFVFKFARLDGVLALLALMVYCALQSGWSSQSIALVATVVRDHVLSHPPSTLLRTRYSTRCMQQFSLPSTPSFPHKRDSYSPPTCPSSHSAYWPCTHIGTYGR